MKKLIDISLFDSDEISDDKLLKMLGIEIIGPVLFSYVNWIIKHAQKNKVTRLYFLARDGEILYKIT